MPVTPDEMVAAVEKHGSFAEAGRVLGVGRETVARAWRKTGKPQPLEKGQRWKPGDAPKQQVTPPVIVEPLPPSDLPFAERLAIMKLRNATRIAHERAKAWQIVRIPIAGPYGICWFGDPHLDDPYCDLDGIERHARICADTEGLYGANGGDSINNWVGKLERIYAEQSATASEGWELVEWFMKDLGVEWLLWILGNHDTWNFGKRIFDGLNTNRILMRDWDAKLRLVSPCGGETTVWARHDFKGTSIYNELHALKRASIMDDEADIYAAFHRHTFATAQGETNKGRRYCLVRAKGYKECDDYGTKLQFPEGRLGQSVVTTIRPIPGGQPIIRVFDDVEEGADHLTMLRAKWAERAAA